VIGRDGRAMSDITRIRGDAIEQLQGSSVAIEASLQELIERHLEYERALHRHLPPHNLRSTLVPQRRLSCFEGISFILSRACHG
jgi:hypothetical protein